MIDLHLEQRYDEPQRKLLERFLIIMRQILEADSCHATNYFIKVLVNRSLIHKEFIKAPLYDMNEVRVRSQGIFSIMENQQKMAQSGSIAVAQNPPRSNAKNEQR